MISNELGAQLVSEAKYLWETSGANYHVGIAVKLSGAIVQQKVLRAGRPIGINLDEHRFAPGEKESPADSCRRSEEANASFEKFWTAVQCEYNGAMKARCQLLHSGWQPPPREFSLLVVELV